MPKEKISAQELGRYLFDSIDRSANAFMENLKESKDKYPGMIHTNIEDIDFRELIIAIMWAVFGLLHHYGKRYEKVTHFLHGAYLKSQGLSKEQEMDQEMDYIGKRYEEYRQAKIEDSSMKKGVMSLYINAITNNILGESGLSSRIFLQMHVRIHLAHCIKTITENLEKADVEYSLNAERRIILDQDNLIPIPRIESRAPQKNTIEWEIPDKVSVCIMLVQRVGYVFLAKVKIKKKHWWNKSWKTLTKSSDNIATAVMEGVCCLEKYGYTISPDSIEIGEKIGDPEYFKKLGL